MLILVIAFAVVINLTPRQLGIADLKIEGKTVEAMGIADTKIVDIYKSVKSLSKVNESDDDPVTKAILNVIVGKIDGVDSVDGLNEKLGEAVSAVTYNLGGIGGVAMDENIYVYGICGVKDHKLSLVTHVK